MSYQRIDPERVARAICDGPNCGLGQLFDRDDEAAIPPGWSRIGIGLGYRIFHTADCAMMWVGRLTLETHPQDGGWEISSPFAYGPRTA